MSVLRMAAPDPGQIYQNVSQRYWNITVVKFYTTACAPLPPSTNLPFLASFAKCHEIGSVFNNDEPLQATI